MSMPNSLESKFRKITDFTIRWNNFRTKFTIPFLKEVGNYAAKRTIKKERILAKKEAGSSFKSNPLWYGAFIFKISHCLKQIKN
jgi:hypothetical protein